MRRNGVVETADRVELSAVTGDNLQRGNPVHGAEIRDDIGTMEGRFERLRG